MFQKKVDIFSKLKARLQMEKEENYLLYYSLLLKKEKNNSKY